MTNPDFSCAVWRKSSRSNGQNGNCVEVATLPGTVAVRDSKNPTGPALVYPPAAFGTFLAAAKNGRLDLA